MPARSSTRPESVEVRRVSLQAGGLVLSEVRGADEGEGAGGEALLPLYAGAMHYWRHPPEEWAAGLDAIVGLGLKLVDVYVPWAVHEVEEGLFDFGERFARLDVARFFRMAHERGLKVILRPGPHINAELTYFGIPERVVWNEACQARTPRGNPVMLPMVPVAFPVPSYASQAFHGEAQRWLTACAKVFAPFRWPEGPVVLLQVDNEGALYFRDGPYDQDYHPDSKALYREFLRAKYGQVEELRRAHQWPQATFEAVEPPHRFTATEADALPPHLDWMEFHEHLLATALGKFASALRDGGLEGIPTTHNFPMGEAATPLNASRMADTIEFVGLDYYQRANLSEHMTVLRRTTELACRSTGLRVPAFGAEVGVGFPPFFAPLDEDDSLYTWMTGLAYGLRGFNLYMVVERDRWVGAPIDPHGRRRPFASRVEALVRALDRVQFHTLRRRAPVRLVVPRALRRLARATHAFGPATPALFNVLGAGYRESCLEEPFGLDEVPTMAGEAYLRTFERALLARGVPFAYAGGEYLAPSLEEAQWVICATAGGVKGEVFEKLRAAQKKGVRVTIGPRVPERDGSMRSMSRPHDVTGLEVEPLLDAADADALVARRIAELGLETYPVHPANVFSVVHEDEAGHPKAVFVMNPSATEAEAQVSLPGVGALEDLLRGGKTTRTGSAFEMVIPARTVRFFAVDGLAPRSVPPPSNRRGSEAPPSSKGRNSRRR